eukprot:UN01234
MDLQSSTTTLTTSPSLSAMPSPMTPFTRNRPRVRKSTLIIRMVSTRNSIILEHNEEKSGYNGNEMKLNKNQNKMEEFDCELCGRTVHKNETTLVDSRYNDQEKVRICEVCLYESDTDSEDETSGDNCDALIDIMHSGPTSVMPSETKLLQCRSDSNENQLGNIQRKMQEMENCVNMLVQKVNENNDNNLQKDKDFKQELVRLQQKMQELFQCQKEYYLINSTHL